MSFITHPVPVRAKISRRKADRSCSASHLYAVLNGMDAGLLSFDHTLAVLVANGRLGSVLGIAPVVLQRCGAVLELLEASPTLTSALVQQVHEACLMAVSGVGATSSLTFSSACGQRVFTVQLSQGKRAMLEFG